MQEFTIDPTFGQLVAQEMKKRGDTRAVAAVKMEISTSMLSDLLTGRPRNYSMFSLKKICEYAHLSADRILGLTEPADDSSMLHTASYITGLSPKAVEMLAAYNESDWAVETRRAKSYPETAQRRRVSNRLLEDEGSYQILSNITQYFVNVENGQTGVDLAANAELANALSVLDRYGYRALTRLELAQMSRQAIAGQVDNHLQELSGERERWQEMIEE